MGRAKIEIKKIENPSARQAGKAFSFGHPCIDYVIDKTLKRPVSVDSDKIEAIRRLESEYNALLQELEVEKERSHALQTQMESDQLNQIHCWSHNWWEEPVHTMGMGELKQHAERLETFYGLIVDRARYLQYVSSLDFPLMQQYHNMLIGRQHASAASLMLKQYTSSGGHLQHNAPAAQQLHQYMNIDGVAMERDMGMSGSASNMAHCHGLQAFSSPVAKAEQHTSFSNMLLLTGSDDNQSPMNQEPVKWASLEQSCIDQEEQQASDRALAREDQQHEAFREPDNHEGELEGATPMDQASATLYLADDYTADNENFVEDVTGNSQYISSFADNVLGNLSGQDDDSASADQFPANEKLNTEIVINVSASNSHQSNNVHDMVVSLCANVDLGDNKGVNISAYVNDHDHTMQDVIEISNGVEKPPDTNIEAHGESNCTIDSCNACEVNPQNMCDEGDMNGHWHSCNSTLFVKSSYVQEDSQKLTISILDEE
ncbi:hypothetical protein GOP47_0005048 [Adiantum capillus-veneris]|uniref:Uncharacterized protein n=1 Tax=Adiantum capillus-veneris TaxID=13818 RepID=A0A9D4ZL80_ADICA|nr:hypothetical protein GOP47_0005048 [Adiantum capillus-veneris]